MRLFFYAPPCRVLAIFTLCAVWLERTKRPLQLVKDLANVSSLKNMRWVFDGKYKGVLKDDILKVLKSPKGKAALNDLLKKPQTAPQVKKWFNMSDFETTISDSHVDYFVNTNYDNLCKLH